CRSGSAKEWRALCADDMGEVSVIDGVEGVHAEFQVVRFALRGGLVADERRRQVEGLGQSQVKVHSPWAELRIAGDTRRTVVRDRIVVVIKTCRDVKGRPAGQREHGRDPETPGQFQSSGEIESLCLIE